MRKTFLSRLLEHKQKTDGVQDYVSTYVPPSIPECRRPLTLRVAVLSWEPHVVGSGQVRGVQFSACVQRYGLETLDESDGFKATFDGEKYMFSSNEKPDEFVHEAKIGSLLRFTVWGMKPSDAQNITYGNVIVVDGVNCTMKGTNLYFNATLVVNIEKQNINFVDFLPNARFSTDGDVLTKMQLNPYYIQGCDHHTDNMPPFFFEDVVMKLRADQPLFKPYIEFNFTMVEGDVRVAVGTTIRPPLCEEFVMMNGIQGVMDNIIPNPDSWNFTLVGYLTSYTTGSKQRVFVTSGFFY